MLILRLLLIFLVFLVLRRVVRALFFQRKVRGENPSGKRNGPAEGEADEAPLDELTQQDISDADFEEIP